MNQINLTLIYLQTFLFFMECGICNAIKKWFTKKDDKGDKGDKGDKDDR